MQIPRIDFRTARWIWDGGEPSPVNAALEFRHTLNLPSPGRRHWLLVTCDNRYHLTINGQWVGYGPCRSYPGHFSYDVVALDPWLAAGANELQIVVHHWGEGTFQSLPLQAGLLAEIQTADGEVVAATDESWQCRALAEWRRVAPRIACQLAFEEQIEAARENEARWQPAVALGEPGCAPWGRLQQRDIPWFEPETWMPVNCERSAVRASFDLILPLRAGPYLLPGDRYSNTLAPEGCFATRFELPREAQVAFKQSSSYGGAVDAYVDGRRVEWAQQAFDLGAELRLASGEHLLVLDWHGEHHDMDVTLAVGGGAASLDWPRHDNALWLFSAGRSDAVTASADASDFLERAADPVAVSPLHTPSEDAYLALSTREPVAAREPLGDALPLRVQVAGGADVARHVFDFGRQGFGFIEIELSAGAGVTLEGIGVEGTNDGSYQFTELANNSFIYHARDGRQVFRSRVLRGLRYLILDARAPSAAEVGIHALKFHQYTYPWSGAGFFRCSDSRLNQIAELCQHSLRVSSTDTFVDATYEQTLWVGDFASMMVPVHAYVQGESRLPERCLRLTAQSLDRLPLVNSQVPSSWENRLIPNWSFFWAIAVKEQVLYSGNLDFGAEMLPALRRQAEAVAARRGAGGLFELHENVWHFLDWNAMALGGMPAGRFIYAHENCLAVAALKGSAQLAGWLGEHSQARWFAETAAELEQAVVDTFFDPERNVLHEALGDDGQLLRTINCSTQICALQAELPGVRSGELAAALLNPPDDWIPTGTPWMWGLGAGFAIQTQSAESVLRGVVREWGRMLDSGATATWEMFFGNHRQGLATRSWAHGWSAAPSWLLPAYILGVRPLEPGWKLASFQPTACGLAWAEGRIPTPHGPIEASWRLVDGQPSADISLPDGVTLAKS